MKKEYQDISDILKKEFNSVIDKLKHIDQQIAQARRSFEDVFHMYQFMDVADKGEIVSMIPPAEVNIQTGDVSIRMNSALVKIICHDKSFFNSPSMNNILSYGTNFPVRNISLKRAVEISAKNNIEINDSEAAIILDFLYQIAQNHNKHEAYNKIETLMRNRTY